jgi:hypothetical protein
VAAKVSAWWCFSGGLRRWVSVPTALGMKGKCEGQDGSAAARSEAGLTLDGHRRQCFLTILARSGNGHKQDVTEVERGSRTRSNQEINSEDGGKGATTALSGLYRRHSNVGSGGDPS